MWRCKLRLLSGDGGAKVKHHEMVKNDFLKSFIRKFRGGITFTLFLERPVDTEVSLNAHRMA
jgi:hypothetical protein